MTRHVLASDDGQLERYLREALRSPNGELRRVDPGVTGGDAVKLAGFIASPAGGDPEVLTIGPDLGLDRALALAAELDVVRPETSVVLLAWPEPQVLERAMRAGIREVLAPDAGLDRVREVLDGLAEAASRRRETSIPRTTTPHRIIPVVAPKGGSGKTTVATNLAVGLAQRSPGAVALVDIDLAFGDVASALGMEPEYSMPHAAAALEEDDSLGPKAFCLEHRTGLFCLCAPDSPEQAELITSERSSEVIRRLSAGFRDVVVDTPAGLEDHTLSVLELATDVVLVCTMDVPSVRSLRKVMVTLDRLGFTHQRRHVVLNRARTKVGLEVRDVERTLGCPIDLTIPSAREIPVSTNQGEPILAQRGSSAVHRSFDDLVEHFSHSVVNGTERTSKKKRSRPWG